MEIQEVTRDLRAICNRLNITQEEERRKTNINWGKVSLYSDLFFKISDAADQIEEDIATHFEPKEEPDTQEKLEADVRMYAIDIVSECTDSSTFDRETLIAFVEDNMRHVMTRQRELCEKND